MLIKEKKLKRTNEKRKGSKCTVDNNINEKEATHINCDDVIKGIVFITMFVFVFLCHYF